MGFLLHGISPEDHIEVVRRMFEIRTALSGDSLRFVFDGRRTNNKFADPPDVAPAPDLLSKLMAEPGSPILLPPTRSL